MWLRFVKLTCRASSTSPSGGPRPAERTDLIWGSDSLIGKVITIEGVSMTARKSLHHAARSKVGGVSKQTSSKRPLGWRYCGFCVIACLLVTIACMSYIVVHNHYSSDGLYGIGDLTRNFVNIHLPASPATNDSRSYKPDATDASVKDAQADTKQTAGGSKEQSVAVTRSPPKKKLRVQPTPSPTLDPKRSFFGFPCGADPSKITTPAGYIVEKYLCLLPTPNKPGLKIDIRVMLENIVDSDYYTRLNRPAYVAPPTNMVGASRAFVEAQQVLRGHPVFRYNVTPATPYELEDVMVYMKDLPVCNNKPIFLSMATVGDDLYWQLIENFVYTMVKFKVSECALVICVSDPKCMKLCGEYNFPCYDFRLSKAKSQTSVMEQIAEIKLLRVPRALVRGVDVFMLDLDVGFLADPSYMIKAFYETPAVDIFVQEDLLFIMNRTKAGWKTWFNEPLPNIGLFLCRGNDKTAKIFELAWAKYNKYTDREMRKNPGKDQNHVLEGMRIGRGTFGLRYAYFSNSTAVLLDKMSGKLHSRSVELGGMASASLLMHEKALAVHTTCYEQTTKVMGLKASNAFWNPRYYDPIRPTLTKQLLYVSDSQLLEEVRSLMWLCLSTGRSLIIPNLLGADDMAGTHRHNNRSMWPGFRVSKLKRDGGRNSLNLDILEPGYYWRVNRDYDQVPKPHLIYFNGQGPFSDNLKKLRSALKDASAHPRVVLHGVNPSYNNKEDSVAVKARVVKWAEDSVGDYPLSYTEEEKRYGVMPSVKDSKVRGEKFVSDVLNGVRNCMNIFGPLKGNRTCFQTCD